jgi:hypothetical protein
MEDFNLATLNGDLNLNLKQGQFTQGRSGRRQAAGHSQPAKLCRDASPWISAMSSPKALPLTNCRKHASGTRFGLFQGFAHERPGRQGPHERCRRSGRETQNLRVTIQPRLEDTVAVAGALLGGPVVGLGTFIANKVLKNPIGQAATFEYTVTGNWAEPVVTKLARPKRPS